VYFFMYMYVCMVFFSCISVRLLHQYCIQSHTLDKILLLIP
jgi:hypothetical protein